MTESKITMIPVAELHPHPDNPRKDVGDVTELAESIRANGILQNLTVVSGHYLTREEWTQVSAEYKAARDPALAEALRCLMNTKWAADGYTVIIGHRRLAAAKRAGMTELPCTVVEMNKKEQISTMLTENIQRCDLTIYEQAQGFQMMLDMGDSVAEISQKSGFSKSTVRKRLEIAKLDAEKLKKASARQISMEDFDALAKIKDMAARNDLLSSIGTENFKNNLAKAVQRQDLQEAMQEWLKVVRSFAKEVEKIDYSAMDYDHGYNQWATDRKAEVPADAGEVQYYYFATDWRIEVYKQKDMDAEAARKAKTEGIERRRKAQVSALQGITRRHYALRSAFVECISNAVCRTKIATICAFAADTIYTLGDVVVGSKALAKLLDLREPLNEDVLLTDDAQIAEYVREQGEKLLLCVAYAAVDAGHQGYWGQEWVDGGYQICHEENEQLDYVYRALESLGYEMSDEERQMQDGTHPIFQPGYFDQEGDDA